VTHEGFGERLGNSMAGLVFGLLISLVLAPMLLFLNEKWAVERYVGLMEAKKKVGGRERGRGRGCYSAKAEWIRANGAARL
jgi:hypothetical protein